ncbi:hypothetical protein LB524_19185 [Mesorhizobium sp. ESP6-5]|uniref:hypothetical protein n=1 Tax=unclassified Mesorhizobium TaxID=325217 RepID=UPI00112CF726|nr:MULTISPECIES: hypothetical protein [unclassified Mesorhizobium]MBZ9757411.1 hypothetical protein [Mesorhizobium sp. ESP6-5]TPK16386.1 hypothetical protein FJ543_13675 [Mesorhizobium sp. B2-5-7]TPK19886.1 hypothetical protein FJ872_12655 [Mesorhizobium sp. B2-5-9]TPK86693.1 hypothetical protein FJ936_04815 [Mesorhizobium sp. B2-4-13]TPL65142.1 hypothetical protein FJ954_28070 [Mesorhizobium sp. B2-3-15]
MKYAAFIFLSMAVLFAPGITSASAHFKKRVDQHRHEKIQPRHEKSAKPAKPMPLYQQIQHRHFKGKDLCWRMYNGNLIDICVG